MQDHRSARQLWTAALLGAAVLVAVVALDRKGATSSWAPTTEAELRLRWAEGESAIIKSPFGPTARFGYSVACPANIDASSVPALAVSAYEAIDQRGAVSILSGADVERCLDGEGCSPTAVIVGPPNERPSQRELSPAEKLKIGRIWTGKNWFGHQVDLRDIDGDGLPELAVGARMARGERGAVFLIYGRDLAAATADGKKKIDLREIPHVELAPNDTREFGFSLILVPPVSARPPMLLVSHAIDAPGSYEGAVDVFDLSSEPKRTHRLVRPGSRFGHNLVYLEATDEIGFGNQALPQENADHVPVWTAKASRIDDVRPYFENASDFGIQKATMPFRLTCDGATAMAAVLSSQTANRQHTSLILIDGGTGRARLLASGNLSGSGLGLSAARSIDADGDGAPDLVLSAPHVAHPSDGITRGAALVFTSRQLCRALAGDRAPIEGTAYTHSEAHELGAKRAQCATSFQGRPLIIMGAYKKAYSDADESAVIFDLSAN